MQILSIPVIKRHKKKTTTKWNDTTQISLQSFKSYKIVLIIVSTINFIYALASFTILSSFIEDKSDCNCLIYKQILITIVLVSVVQWYIV